MHNHWPVRLIITFVAIVLLLNTPTHSQERKFRTLPHIRKSVNSSHHPINWLPSVLESCSIRNRATC